MSFRLSALFSIICLLALSSLLAPTWAYATDDNGIYDLTELDFQQAIEDSANKYLLVNFHALWCRYSKKLKPEWVTLVEPMKALNVKLARVEAYDEKKLAEQYGVEGYPTIKLFINKAPYDYTGERNAVAITEFVKRMLKVDLNTVGTASDVKDYLKSYEWVGILAGTTGQDAVKDVAFNIQDVLFLTTTSDDVKKAYNLEDGQFVLVNNVSGSSDVDTDAITIDSLTTFINSHKFPSIAPFTKGTAEQVFLSDAPSLILIRKNDDNTPTQAFTDANKNLGSKIFMTVAVLDDKNTDAIGNLLAKNLGVETFPAVVIVRADKERIRKYILDTTGGITADSIQKFYDDYTNKKATRLYLSEPVPETNNDLVKKVVTKTFEEIVLDENKDVLLHIWAPWCGHCRAMMPVYDNVARKTEPVPNFVVAKIDASVNDLEGFGLDIVEYPTLLLFKSNDKANPIEFKDERNEYRFDDFIRTNAAVDLGRMKGPNPFDKNEL